MTVEYLAGKRVKGSSTERGIIPVTYDLRAGTTVGANNSNLRGFGNKILTGNDLIGTTITKVGFELRNLSGGTITLGVWNNDSSTPVFTFGTVTSTTGSFVLYERENLTGYVLSVNQIIGIGISGGNTLEIQRYNDGVGASASVEMKYNAISSGENWQIAGDNQDLNMKVTTLAKIQNGTVFEETDTNKSFIFNSSTGAWTQF